ncbi:MAG: hypothetical protein F6K19_05040 [Cyanothece sp. SIO1E1]|nr:hypothetical protein [Cyanothece sp. SIO1E1]
MLDQLCATLSSLQKLEAQVQASGEAAPANIWIDTPTVKGKQYARLRSDRPLFNGKRLQALGRVDSAEHQDWQLRIKRRNALAEIQRRCATLQEWIEAEAADPLWSLEIAQAPASIAKEPEALPKTTKIKLWLRVENNNKFIRCKKKVRGQIEQWCLSDYDMKKLGKDSWEYELTIPYETDEELDKRIYDLFREMDNLADLEFCFIEVDAREIGTDRSW